MAVGNLSHTRRTQAERRAQSRDALLDATARALSRNGYGNLRLEDVAREAGYTRGALYHQFADKQALVLATVHWVDAAWRREVGDAIDPAAPPLEQLLAVSRGHAIFCRRDIARVVMALRVEFSGHPIGAEIERIDGTFIRRCAKLISAGRKDGSIPEGAPAATVARALYGAVEGTVIALRGRAPHDAELAMQAAAGVLLQPARFSAA